VNVQPQGVWQIGDWRVSPDIGEISRGGRCTKLDPRAMRLLMFMAARPGQVVRIAELLDGVWQETAVTPHSVYEAVAALRNALGDPPDRPAYLVTLPRRGYRLIAPVVPGPQRSEATASAKAAIIESASVASPTVPISAAFGRSVEHASHTARHELTKLPENAVTAPKPMSGGRALTVRDEAGSSTADTSAPVRRPRSPVLAVTATLTLAALLVGSYALWRAPSGRIVSVRVEAPSQSANIASTHAVVFAPPAHSIAVLPFVNLSGDQEQEYFSDGLTEELLNSLAHIDGLQVAARTSSFSFRQHPDVADVAHRLNVATVLEGSVRRSGHTVRISAQLINAGTGFHLWSNTYDRDLGDVLKLQTEIASAVASALEVALLGDVGAKIELGGTRNPAAFDAYLRGSRVAFGHDAKEIEAAIAGYSEAIRLDPNYALAFAWRSQEWTAHAEEYAKGANTDADDRRALADARQAVTLAPGLAEAHLALAYIFQDRVLDLAQTKVELERAVALAPGNAQVLGWYGRFAVMTGRTNVGIAAARRAVMLDPLNIMSHYRLGQSLYRARRYAEAVAAFSDVLALDPQDQDSPGLRGLAYFGLGDLQSARASCEVRPDNRVSQWCLAVTYHMLARHEEAEAALAKLRAVAGNRWAYECAAIYAQWGKTSQALESLESAWRLRVPELPWLKTEPLMDPLRQEPRFRAIEQALKFPN
jgi:TolB-like protein/DNA-binding winged helix-turn-helix (wHTH) protein/Tfp pilus assembly protein PilF